MKTFVLFTIFSICLISCSSFKNSEVEYLEDISNVEFPSDIIVYETFDNAEFLMGGVFGLNQKNFLYFKSKLKFDKMVRDTFGGAVIWTYDYPNSFLEESINNFTPSGSIIFWEDCRKGNQISFCIDTVKLMMWCQSKYPDNSGDFPCKDSLK